jgi:hypothetical protein
MPQTPQFDPTAAYQPAATTAVFDPNADYAPAKKTAPQAGLLDREIQLNDHWDAWGSGLQSVGRGVRDAVKGTWQTLAAPPQDDTETAIGAIGPAALPLYRMLRSLGHTAEDATQVVGAIHDINDSADPAGTYLKAGQETAGQGAGQAILALATEGAARVLPKAVDVATSPTKATAPVRAAVKATNKVLAKAPGSIGAAAGATVGHYIPVPGAAEVGAAAGYAIGKEVLPQVRLPGEGFGLPSRVKGGPLVAPKYAPPAAAATAAAEDLEGVTSPQTEAAGETAEQAAPEHVAEPVEEVAEPVETPKPVAKPASKFTTATGRIKPAVGKQLQTELERGLGNEAPAPAAQTAPAAAAAELPADFTPTPKSSALRGYKYDPAAREFEYITTDGSHYIRGDVAPEAADQFEKTAVEKDSFGKAWHELRQNPQGGVGVAKVINGKRVPIVKTAPLTDLQQQIKESVPPSQAPTGAPLTDLSKQIKQSAKRTVVVDASGKPEFSDVIEAKQAKPAAAAAPEEDLSAPDSDWQKTLEQAKAKKAAAAPTVEEIPDNVMTMRDPGDLAKRWGVDSESLAAGREQTRGMSPAQTEASIAKLTERYKKGFPVEPVMETRDAGNNLIEVDGRARAIAAQRAGVKQIPIIVRRLAKVPKT